MKNSERIKNAIKKLPLARLWLSPIQSLRAGQLKDRKRNEALAFEQFFNTAFSNVEDGSLVVNIPDLGGRYEIGFHSHILLRVLRKKQYEPELVALAKQYLNPEKDVLDIGANIGLFTAFFAQRLKNSYKVLAIEPTPLAQYYLRRNIERNGVGPTVINFEGLATESPGRCEINVIPGKEEYSSLGEIVHFSTAGQVTQKISVVGETVDNLVERYHLHPGFIKMDTEGAELLVLRGSGKTLREERPVLLMELSDQLLASLDSSSSHVLSLLQENGYRLKFVMRGARRTSREEHPVLFSELPDQSLASQESSYEQLLAVFRACGYHIENTNDLIGAITHPFDGSILAVPEI
ncbi:MAG: FkbM family methyltransferase [Chloroflexi bacterium]|nr:FkbM family methyltransferase [Chloroflexota bacterium]